MSDTRCRLCSEPATFKCSLCKAVSYCCKEHQKQDWKAHRDDCLPFEIKSSPELGRYLEARRTLSEGDPVITELPIILGPRGNDAIVCVGCASANPLSKCPLCYWPACQPECAGLKDLDKHGAECIVLRLQPHLSEYKFDALLPLRCLLLQRRSPSKWKTLMEMESHLQKRGPDTEIYKRVQEDVVDYLTQNFFAPLDRLEKDKETKVIEDRSSEILHKIYGILDVNALEIRISSESNLHAMYPTAYIMEHNCLPNTRHVFDPDTFKITVVVNQNVNQGSHISTMYTHALWGTYERQDHLRSTKHFLCRCRRCGDPTELGTYLSALKCLAPIESERKICGGSQLPLSPFDQNTRLWQCEHCPTSLTQDQVTDLVNLIGNEVDQCLINEPTVDSLSNLLEKLRKLLHPKHYHCYHVMHTLVQLIGRQPGYLSHQVSDQLLKKKLSMCQDLLSINQTLDPTGSRLMLYSSPVRIELCSSTLLLAGRGGFPDKEVISRLEYAKKELNLASKELRFEPNGSPGAKLRDLVEQSSQDLISFCSINNIVI